jgi:hypothetical protein
MPTEQALDDRLGHVARVHLVPALRHARADLSESGRGVVFHLSLSRLAPHAAPGVTEPRGP